MSLSFANIGLIVSARCDSTRLPGKVMRRLNNKPMINFLLDRLAPTKEVQKIILATTTKKSDDKLSKIVENNGFEVFRGSENNLIKRYVDAAKKYNFDYVVRVTGDCPLVDSNSLDYCINLIKTKDEFDLASTKGFFPVGIDYEIYPAKLMERISKKKDVSNSEKEHLTLYIYNHKRNFKILNLKPKKKWITNHKFTVDTLEDFEKVNSIVEKNSNFTCEIMNTLLEI